MDIIDRGGWSFFNGAQCGAFYESMGGKYQSKLLNLSHIYWIIQEICSTSDLDRKKASHWDKGAGFQLKGTKRYFDEFNIDQNRIWCIKRGVADVNRIIHPEPDLPKSERKVRPKWLKCVQSRLSGFFLQRYLPKRRAS